MRKTGLFAAVLIVGISALFLLAANRSSPVADVIFRSEFSPENDALHLADETTASPGAAARDNALQPSDAMGAEDILNQRNPKELPPPEAIGTDATGAEDTLDQQVSLLQVEPLGASCCPQPAPEEAVRRALALSGVERAELLDTKHVVVHFDPGQTDITHIASAINQAAFLVTVEEEDISIENPAVARKRGDN